MGDFNKFFKENVKVVDNKKTVEISERMPEWTLQPLTQKRQFELADKHKIGQATLSNMENLAYLTDLVSETVIEPNLRDAELQDTWGVMGEMDLLDEMLTGAGEYKKLLEEVRAVNGMKDPNKLMEEAKN